MARPRWADRHWDAHLAHAAVSRAIKRGDLTPKACEQCDKASVVAHHDDYTKPLGVRWLCDSHHRLWHIEHPVEYEVLAPPHKTKAPPITERTPNRGKQFHRYKKPRANYLRRKWGYSYAQIAQELGVSISTAFRWCEPQKE